MVQDIRQLHKVAFCSQTNVKTYDLMDSFGIYLAKTSKPHLFRKGQLHVLAVLSQLLYGHFVQPNEVASSHPVGEKEIIGSGYMLYIHKEKKRVINDWVKLSEHLWNTRAFFCILDRYNFYL